MRREGQMETGMTIWVPIVFTVIFLVLNTAIFALQEQTGTQLLDFYSPHPNTGNRINQIVQDGAEIRKDSTLPGALLTADYDGRYSVKEWVQAVLYCQVSGSNPPDAPCSFGDLESRVQSLLPDQKYHLIIQYQGEKRFEAERYRAEAYSGGPTVYQVYIPMPGGTRARMQLTIDGPQGGVRWEQ